MRNAKRKSLVFTLVFSLLLPAIFAIAPQTAFGITLLHEFASGADDGRNPFGSLLLSGSTLYGMTGAGGDNSYGTVFKINTDGTGHTLLREFAGGTDDGRMPLGSLTLSGSTLYGMTFYGGDNNRGVVYKVNTDGTGYNHLHEFAGGAYDGATPKDSLILSGSTLYGMTNTGGDHNDGVVFKVNTDGTGYGLLHEFAWGADDGANPNGSLILSGSTLYGMTEAGGDHNDGVIFKVNTDGTGYNHLREFTGGADDGGGPFGSLILSGSTLYGMTSHGGDDDYGTVFQVNTDGGSYGLLHEFTGYPEDGRVPCGSLTLSGSTLYGMTYGGGDYNFGVVFALEIPEPSTLLLLAPALVSFAALLRKKFRGTVEP